MAPKIQSGGRKPHAGTCNRCQGNPFLANQWYFLSQSSADQATTGMMHALCAVFAWRLIFGLHNVASNGYHDDTERWTQSQEFVVSISWPENLAFSLLIGDHCKIVVGMVGQS